MKLETTDTEKEYFVIPNPIYDVVFRYLMEDMDSATVVVSTLINEKIKKLHLEPITHAEKKEKLNPAALNPNTKDDIKLFHLDFMAVIELPNGEEELIMIEVQKASEPDDIFRFKRYISKNFKRKQKQEITDPFTKAIKNVERPIRLIPIFILNFRIENEINDLLIKTNRIKYGIFKDKHLAKHNEFIDNLTYDIWVVQLPNLKNITPQDYDNDEYKTKLFALLKLFDQDSKIKDNEHRLKLIRKIFPNFLDRVISRLQAADSDNPDLEEQMFAEDEYVKALIDRDNTISFLELNLQKEKEKREEQERIVQEQEKTLQEQEKTLQEQENIILSYARMLKTSGKSSLEIQAATGLSLEKIEQL